MEIAEEIKKFFFVFGINYPAIFFRSVVTDKTMMSVQVKVLLGSKQGAWGCRAARCCKVGVSTVVAAAHRAALWMQAAARPGRSSLGSPLME